MNDPAINHFGQWGSVILWILIYAVFLLFTPFYQKSQRKPTGAYLAFIVALALEMFGVPLSMYVIAWLFGATLPDGVLWGHTLNQYIGHWGMYIGLVLMLIGAVLIIIGWREIYRRYWRQETGQGQLVTNGIYSFIRHPQYTGFMLITLGMLLDWATIPLLIMWPLLIVLYYRLARREEADMEREFGPAYVAYKQHTGMFFPRLRPRTAAPVTR
jgi:protein-S-isoprenylcysteine O-methyltransferase Ste14